MHKTPVLEGQRQVVSLRDPVSGEKGSLWPLCVSIASAANPSTQTHWILLACVILHYCWGNTGLVRTWGGSHMLTNIWWGSTGILTFKLSVNSFAWGKVWITMHSPGECWIFITCFKRESSFSVTQAWLKFPPHSLSIPTADFVDWAWKLLLCWSLGRCSKIQAPIVFIY